ncbi:MAG: hypothetical protein IPH30_06800 [Betaproteobacteria bacterium]|nr:hypothetical protein [Betaproteobacteria bacterium]
MRYWVQAPKSGARRTGHRAGRNDTQENDDAQEILAIATLATAALVPIHASAGDAGLGALVGATIGAAIGHNVNGRHGAVVGGLLGAVTGASIAADAHAHYDPRYGAPPVSYAPPAPVYYAPRTYYAPAPVYYSPPPVVVRARPVIVHQQAPRRPVYAPIVVERRHDRRHDRHDYRWH